MTNFDYTNGGLVDEPCKELIGRIEQLTSGKCSHISYMGDPINYWISENKWKDKELKYLVEKLEAAEEENKLLRRKLYCIKESQ